MQMKSLDINEQFLYFPIDELEKMDSQFAQIKEYLARMKEQFQNNDQKIEDQIRKLEAIYDDSNQEAIKNIR